MDSHTKDEDAQQSSLKGQTLEANELLEVDKALEQRIIGKFDKWLMPQVALLVLFGYLDRTNIGMLFYKSCGIPAAVDPRH